MEIIQQCDLINGDSKLKTEDCIDLLIAWDQEYIGMLFNCEKKN